MNLKLISILHVPPPTRTNTRLTSMRLGINWFPSLYSSATISVEQLTCYRRHQSIQQFCYPSQPVQVLLHCVGRLSKGSGLTYTPGSIHFRHDSSIAIEPSPGFSPIRLVLSPRNRKQTVPNARVLSTCRCLSCEVHLTP